MIWLKKPVSLDLLAIEPKIVAAAVSTPFFTPSGDSLVLAAIEPTMSGEMEVLIESNMEPI
jgi:hypothetical protein